MPNTNTCMAVYQFDKEVIELFHDVVRPLIETHTGLTYIDGMSHYEPVNAKMDLITRLISNATLIIIDVSFKNPNVFAELGIAYALKKPIVFLCSKNKFHSTASKGWARKMPFDIEGKELLIFDNSNDLKVKLGRFISDSLFKTQHTTVSWTSTSEKNHVKSSSELEFFEAGEFWSHIGVNKNFILAYHVLIHKFDDSRNPDLRLFFSSRPNSYPRIEIIFPWEHSEINKERYECHIDYFESEQKARGKGIRLQQISVAPITKGKFEFDVFISFYEPNVVFESTLFDDTIDRLVVPLSRFRELGFATHFSQYIGFGSGHHISISKIEIREVFM